MIEQLFTYKYREYLFSLAEKYSLAILQLLTTLVMTSYFGFQSIGMVGSFSLIVSTATVLCECGATYEILGENIEDRNTVSISLILSLAISLFLYLLIFLFAPIFSELLGDNKLYIKTLRFYAFLVFTNPIQLISYAVFIKIKKTKYLFNLNIFSWVLSLIILFAVGIYLEWDYRAVVVYFVSLSFFRSALALWWLFKHGHIGRSFRGEYNLSRRLSLIGSQISNSVSANIWTTIVAVAVSLEANSVLALFIKLRDMSVGNMSHALHRIVYSRLGEYKTKERNSMVYKSLLIYGLFTILILGSLWVFRDLIKYMFSVELVNSDYLIVFVLLTGALYPFTDFFKSLLRYWKQRIVLRLDILLLICVALMYLVSFPIQLSFTLYLLLCLIQAGTITYYVQKSLQD